MGQLKDPEPGHHAHKVCHQMKSSNPHEPAITAPEVGKQKGFSEHKSTMTAHLKQSKPGHDTDNLPHHMETVIEHKPVQDLVIHLTNPDVSSPKLAVSAGLKRKIDNYLLSKKAVNHDMNVKPPHKKHKLATNPRKSSETNTNRSKILQNKVEFPYGTVVSINGKDMHDARWTDRDQAPTFIGIVENPRHHDGKEAESIDEDYESMVTFALAGHYEWLDTELLNTMTGVFNDETLNLISLPTQNDKKLKYRGEKDPMRNIDKQDGKYVIRKHKNPCMACGSPWCKFKKNTEAIINIVDERKADKNGESNKQKRFKCYIEIAHAAKEATNQGFRMRLGWCVENYVRSAFPKLPEDEYTGFKYGGKDMRPYAGDSSDSDVLYKK